MLVIVGAEMSPLTAVAVLLLLDQFNLSTKSFSPSRD